MQIKILRKYEGNKVRILLKNGFTYSNIVFTLTSDFLIEFKDKFGEVILLEPDYITGITEIGEELKK